MRSCFLPAPVQSVTGFKRNVADQNFSVFIQTAAQCGQKYDFLRVCQMVQPCSYSFAVSTAVPNPMSSTDAFGVCMTV